MDETAKIQWAWLLPQIEEESKKGKDHLLKFLEERANNAHSNCARRASELLTRYNDSQMDDFIIMVRNMADIDCRDTTVR